uniref:Uncharacterized protein n=1 Tax=Anguilla anguilla TaxID=7936 RepID=A0A0E9U494_ANGAN
MDIVQFLTYRGKLGSPDLQELLPTVHYCVSSETHLIAFL